MEKETIKSFVADFTAIPIWFRYQPRSSQEIVKLYQVIKTMWGDYRDVFPNKGTYKTVRRLFIKYAAAHYALGVRNWSDLPEDLFTEIIYKGRQGWLPRCEVSILFDHLRKDLNARKAPESYRHLFGLWYLC